MVKDPEVKKKWLDIAGVASRHSLGSGTNVKLPLVRENRQGWVYLCPWGCLYDGVFPVDERFAFLQLYVVKYFVAPGFGKTQDMKRSCVSDDLGNTLLSPWTSWRRWLWRRRSEHMDGRMCSLTSMLLITLKKT